MKKMTTNEIRKAWLDFFVKNNHLELPSKSLIPINDPSLLWINSGVATLKDFFSGKTNPPVPRLVNSQKAIRTNDIFNVGVTSRHLTFFEMLGNFSIGDYFKETAIELGYKLLTQVFEIPVQKLYFTVFEDDTIAYDQWIKNGVMANHIIKCGRDRNFWDVGSGPCGPCTEIFYDRGEKYDPLKVGVKLFEEDIENDRYVEIWNIVFSQYNNDGNNNYEELTRKNIDTGAGLERIAAISQDVPTNFDTDAFIPIIRTIESFTKKRYKIENYFSNEIIQKEINRAFRIIADHIKAATFAINDGAIPSSKERGSIIRKLIRRAMVNGKKLEIDTAFISTVSGKVIEIMSDYYPDLKVNSQKIKAILDDEEILFNKTLVNGLKIFETRLRDNELDGKILFKLLDTYGFPLEIIKEIAKERNFKVDEETFQKMFKQHQIISKSKLDVKAMAKQNSNLLKFDLPSTFDYNNLQLNDAKVIALFDSDFNAVEEIDSEGWVAFDKTVFYATSGGQQHDLGSVSFNNNIYQVLDVIKAPNLQHLHFIKTKKSIKVGDLANMLVDYKNRMLTSSNHSVEHLIHRSMKDLIDSSIKQEGAFKSAEKVTFDFQFYRKLTNVELEQIEERINSYIKTDTSVELILTDLENAKRIGAIAYFEDVYSKINNKLRVVKMGQITCELCGGTHVLKLGDIEQFMITDYYSKGSGSWRIEGITNDATILDYLSFKTALMQKQHVDLTTRYKQLTQKNSEFEMISNINWDNTASSVRNNAILIKQAQELLGKLEFADNANKIEIEGEIFKSKFVQNINCSKNTVVALTSDNLDKKAIIEILSELKNEFPQRVLILINEANSKLQYFVIANDDFINLNPNFSANSLIKKINLITSGSGGGKNSFAQGGSSDRDKIPEIINFIDNYKI